MHEGALSVANTEADVLKENARLEAQAERIRHSEEPS
jgi:hypothetical protein